MGKLCRYDSMCHHLSLHLELRDMPFKGPQIVLSVHLQGTSLRVSRQVLYCKPKISMLYHRTQGKTLNYYWTKTTRVLRTLAQPQSNSLEAHPSRIRPK